MNELRAWVCPECGSHNTPLPCGYINEYCVRGDFNFYRGPIENGYYIVPDYTHTHGFCAQVYCDICSDRQQNERLEFEERVKGTKDDLIRQWSEGLISEEDIHRIFREMHGREEDGLFRYDRRPGLMKN